ncbi:putative cruciform dna recognition protein [Achaetomium macrosporum]|uniref:Cruciform dna recognition protein n=1 Tax=Achaetomium macrosporum TaxID=79813 RepID=A0AAN7CGH9_9PEZI|nr:putative cruciform dna recognition protein [Achaetomium macrosporum]
MSANNNNNNNNNNNPSTLKSYVDSATGAVQNALGNIVGTPGDQAEGKAKQQRAQAEYDASHTAAKLPGMTVSSEGVAKDHPDRSAGSWNQTAGAAKEFVGGLVGNESLKQSGREQNLSGQEQEARGQVKDYTSGVGDRVSGAVGSAVAGLTGDRAKQAEYQNKHDAGKTQQRGAELDIQKQAEARQ